MPDAMASQARDTVFALLATYLALGSQNPASQFANVPRNSSGQRFFMFEGAPYLVMPRAPGQLFEMPGVNVYFGGETATERRVKPQWYILPVHIHVLVEWTEQAKVGEKLALRLSEQVMNAFEGLGGAIQMSDYTQSPPSPTPGRFVSWQKFSRGNWAWIGMPSASATASSSGTAQGEPAAVDVFTNRRWSWQAWYRR
jgi:hypothetical protein